MSDPIRFTVDVNENWLVTVTGPGESVIGEPRQMLKTDDGHGGFYPQPPQKDLPATGDLHRELCVQGHEAVSVIHQLHTAIRDRLPVKDLNLRFGRYLFHCLIGCETWAEIEKAASAEAEARKGEGDAGAGEVIELALRWPAQAPYLHRMNWEMMCRPAILLDSHPNSYGFLADGFPRRVAITRHVAGAEHASREVGCPPKILFVVGSRPHDPRILPGLELVGLLDRLEGKRRIHYDVLLRARPSTIREKMRRFEPDIVHFICHGEFDQQGSYLLMYNDEAEADKRRDASALLQDLKSHGSLPAIVVLSACHSAVSQGPHQIGPMAAGLVAGGVPVVVGMAGQVSDLACRLFTRRFAEALVLGQPLVSATAEGRAAAVYGGKRVLESADWAFPSIFMSPQVGARYKPWPLVDGTTDPGIVLENRVKRYADKRGPIFCNRYSFFKDYYTLLDPDEDASLQIIYTPSGKPRSDMGKTRLLKELAARAVRDGYVPCLLSDNLGQTDDDHNKPVIRNTTQWGLKVVEAIDHASKAFGLPPPVDSSLLSDVKDELPEAERTKLEKKENDLGARAEEAGDPEERLWHLQRLFASQLAACREYTGDLDAGIIGADISSDLGKLATRVCREHPELKPEGNGPLVLVFLDDVDQYDEKVIRALTGTILKDSDGLGTATRPVPVIMTFSQGRGGGGILYNWVEKTKGKTLMVERELGPFAWVDSANIEEQLAGEDIQAWERALLNPFKKEALPGVSDRPLTINPSADLETKNRWVSLFRNLLRGCPGLAFEVNDGMLWGLAQTAVMTDDFFVEGENEQQLRELEEKMRSGTKIDG